MATNSEIIEDEIEGSDDGSGEEFFAYPNGTCQLPSLDFLREEEPEFAVPMSKIAMRIGLRVPVLVFALIAIYITLMLVVDSRRRINRRGRKRFAAHLKIGRLVAAAFTAVILTYNSLSLLIEISGNVNCNWYWKFEYAMYWLNISIVYTVLWMRQRAIYNEPNLRRVVSKVTSCFSYATVAMVFALPAVNTLIYSFSMNICYADYQKICLIPPIEGNETLYTLLNVVEFTVPIVLPMTLLFLFAWPLIQYHRSTNQNAKGQRSLTSVLWRILIVTIICFVTDMASMICNMHCDLILMLTLQQFSAFSNLVCLVLSFADWRDIFLPLSRSEAVGDSEASSSGVTISLRELHTTD